MNKFNVKLGSAFALVAVLASVILPAVSVGAMNDPEFDSALMWGYDTGLTRYNSEDAFMPMGTLTREQGAKFLSVFAGEVLGIEADATMDCTFSDAASIDSTLAASVAMACGQGLLKGSNGMFMPTAPMTKAQFVTALVRGLDGMMDETTSPWYMNYCTWAQDNGITRETDCMALDKPITRYEALLMLYRGRVAGVDPIDPIDPTDPTDPIDVVAGGEVSLNIADNTPGVQYVPGTSTNIQTLKFDVTAGENAVGITSINFKLAGLVNRANVRVSLTDADGVRLSTERSFNTNFEALVTANTSAGIRIPANTTRSFYAVVSTSGSVNERFVISIDSAASVSSTATVGGTFPIVSNQVNTTQYSSQQITFRGDQAAAATGTISDKLYVGNTNKQLGKFSLDTTSSNSRDITVKNIRLKSTDNVAGVLSNLKLEVNGVNVAQSVIVDGKFVTFIIEDYLIEYGNSKTFYVVGDVIGGEKNDNVQFFLDTATDVVALENGTNASVSVVSNDPYLRAYTIVEGDNYITRADSLTSNRNIPADADKVLALRANINTTSEMSVDRIRVNYSGTATGSSVESVELYVNGLLVDEQSPFVGNGSAGTLDFAFFGNLNAGSNTVEVRIDTQRNAPDGGTIKFSIDNSSLVGAEYTATSNTVASTDISGTADGVFLIIRKASVERIFNTFVANPQIAIREGDITAIKFSIQANNVRDLVVRGFSVNLSGASNANGGVQDATLYVAGMTDALDIESFSRGQAVSFNGLNVTIPAGTSKEFWIVAKTTVDLSSAATMSPFDLQFFVNNFDIEDSEGNSTTIPAASQTVNGNMIDVKAALEIFGNRTSVEQSTIIPASTASSVTVGTFELKSDYADAVVEEITLVNLTTAFTGTSVSSANVSGFIETNSDGAVVELYQGATKVGEAQLGNGIAYITMLTPVTINAGGTAVFTVRVKSNTTITSAGDTNKKLRLGVLNPGALGLGSTSQTLISAVGNSITASGAFTNLVFNQHVLRATNITFADQAITDSSANSLLSIAGQNEATLFRTVVTANSSKSANLYALKFRYAANGVTGTNFKLRVDNTVLSTGDANCVPTATEVTCTFGSTYINGLTIAAGGSRTIALVADVTASTASSDYITTSLNEGAAGNFEIFTATGAAAAGATVVWSDNAEPNVTPASVDWFTDAGVEKLPSNAWTFTRSS